MRTLHERSGHRVLRALIGQVSEDQVVRLQQTLTASAEAVGISCEWHGTRFIAFDVPPEVATGDLVATLSMEAAAGRLQFGWTAGRQFSPL